MAIRNRKLFPSLTYTNETTYCPDFCDPTTCPYDCPTFIPYLPPPLPPPPPPSPSSGATHVSPSFITASSILVAFFFLIGYYIIIAKSCFRRPTRDSARPAVETEFVDGNRVDHPIWLIATAGLQQSVINAITICQYRKGEGLIEGTECSVCLNEFREEETLRLLPKCSHAFHISCIDTWLRSHTNCPLCRANIVTPDDVGFVSAVDSAAREDSRVSLEIQVEDTQNRGETEEGRSLQEVELVVNGDSGTKEMNVGDKNEIEPGIRIVNGMDCYSSSEGIQETEEGRKQRIGKGVVFRDKDMVGVERSQSCNGGFVLSRHSRRTSSILP